jgi:hypothetical protein
VEEVLEGITTLRSLRRKRFDRCRDGYVVMYDYRDNLDESESLGH